MARTSKYPPGQIRTAAGFAGISASIAAVILLAVLVLVAKSVGESSRGLVAAVADAVFWSGAAALYLAPSLVAVDRGHPGRKAVIALNVLVGWTGIGWLALLVLAFRPASWSFVDDDGPAIPPPRKRCRHCRRHLQIDAASCLYCGAEQASESLVL